MLDWAVVGARAGEYAATLLLFGSALFYLDNDPAAEPEGTAAAGGARRLLRIACAFALLACLAFLMTETVSLTGVASDAFDGGSLWSVVSTTRFGALTALRIGLLLAAMLAALALAAGRRLWLLEGALGGCVVASYAWTGHGALDDGLRGAVHLGADVVHLLAAGLWAGALLPLAQLIQRAIRARSIPEAQSAAMSLERFSRIGPAVVGLLALSGLANAWYLIGPGRGSALFTSAYGRVLLIKLALFALMLVLAALNRLRLTPRLRGCMGPQSSPALALRALRLSVTGETLLALLVLAVVAVLGVLEPPVSLD